MDIVEISRYIEELAKKQKEEIKEQYNILLSEELDFFEKNKLSGKKIEDSKPYFNGDDNFPSHSQKFSKTSNVTIVAGEINAYLG